MDTVYLVSLLVGGFFVLLSVLGGDADADADMDFDTDADFDLDGDLDADFDGGMDHGSVGAGPGFVDLLSLRALFLFAAFFGLAGTALSWIGTSATLTAILATGVGLIAGLFWRRKRQNKPRCQRHTVTAYRSIP